MLDDIHRQIAGLSEKDRLCLLNELLVEFFPTLDGERIVVDDAGETLGVLCPMLPAHLLPQPGPEELARIRQTPRRPAREIMDKLWGTSQSSSDMAAAQQG
jgi:hypothetical protein